MPVFPSGIKGKRHRAALLKKLTKVAILDSDLRLSASALASAGTLGEGRPMKNSFRKVLPVREYGPSRSWVEFLTVPRGCQSSV
jgi:hypothetical protein